MILAWWRPLVGGVLIAVAGTALGVIFAVATLENAGWLPTIVLFFGPAVVGGLLFAAAGVVAARSAVDR